MFDNDMNIYLGACLVMLCFAYIVVYLSRNGIILKNFEFKNLFKGEFDTSQNRVVNIDKLANTDIIFSETATKEYVKYGYDRDNIISFILKEQGRHVLIYRTSFSSLPLVYKNHVLLFSWDLSKIFIETIIKRDQVYSTFDKWATALSYYRKAMILPYRYKSPDCLLQTQEAKRTFQILKKLSNSIENFIDSSNETINLNNLAFKPLLDEVEFAFIDNNIDVAVSRMEMLLSSIHKLLLENVPGAEKTDFNPEPISSKIALNNANARKLLLVDDERNISACLVQMIYCSFDDKCDVTYCQDSVEALSKLVNSEFEIVITDIVMPKVSGYDIINCASKINSVKKIIAVSGYKELDKSLIDSYNSDKISFIIKPFEYKVLQELLEEYL